MSSPDCSFIDNVRHLWSACNRSPALILTFFFLLCLMFPVCLPVVCWTRDSGLCPDWPASLPGLPLPRERSVHPAPAASDRHWARWPPKTCACCHRWVRRTCLHTHLSSHTKNNNWDHLSEKYVAQEIALNKPRLVKGETGPGFFVSVSKSLGLCMLGLNLGLFFVFYWCVSVLVNLFVLNF